MEFDRPLGVRNEASWAVRELEMALRGRRLKKGGKMVACYYYSRPTRLRSAGDMGVGR